METAQKCEVCSQLASFQCSCGVVLCRNCVNSHHQNTDSQHAFTALPVDIFSAIEETAKALDSAYLTNHTQDGSELHAAEKSIDTAIDECLAILERKRQELKEEIYACRRKKPEQTVGSYLASLVNEAEGMKGKLTGEVERCKLPMQAASERLYLVRGWSVYAFDPSSGQINEVVDCEEAFPRDGAYCLALDHRIFHCGGKSGYTSISQSRLVSLVSGVMECKANMTYARREHAVLLLDDTIYVLGGYSGRELMQECERFSLITHQFRPMGSMIHARGSLGAVVNNGKIYVSGYGRKDDPEVCNCIEVYDSASDSFTAFPYSFPSNSLSAGFLVGESVAFLRGYHLCLYTPSTHCSQQISVSPRRYYSPTPALVCSASTFLFIASDKNCCILQFCSATKTLEEVKDLKTWLEAR